MQQPSLWHLASSYGGGFAYTIFVVIRLSTRETFVQQNLDFNTTVLGPPLLGFIRCRWLGCAHRTRRPDMPHRHVALVDTGNRPPLQRAPRSVFPHIGVTACRGLWPTFIPSTPAQPNSP